MGEIGLWGVESRGGETRKEAGAGGQASVAGGGREVAGFGIDSELWCGFAGGCNVGAGRQGSLPCF